MLLKNGSVVGEMKKVTWLIERTIKILDCIYSFYNNFALYFYLIEVLLAFIKSLCR